MSRIANQMEIRHLEASPLKSAQARASSAQAKAVAVPYPVFVQNDLVNNNDNFS